MSELNAARGRPVPGMLINLTKVKVSNSVLIIAALKYSVMVSLFPCVIRNKQAK